MTSVVRQRGARLAAGAAAVGVAATSSTEDSATECYSQPPSVTVESIEWAVELLKPGHGDTPSVKSLELPTLTTSVNADGRRFHDVDFDIPDKEMADLLAVVQSAACDPAVMGALAANVANRHKQPVVDRMMQEQPSIKSLTHSASLDSTSLEHESAGLEHESAVLVEPDSSVQSVSSFGSLSESLLLEANEELRAENVALKQENATLRAEKLPEELPATSAPGPVRTRINVGEDGQCCVTLRLRLPALTDKVEKPAWLQGARQALMESVPLSMPAAAVCRGEENTEGPPAEDPHPDWHPALVVGAVVIVGTLALALSRNPKFASVAVKKAALAIRMLIATFRIPV
jgi:hypothetical protein